MADRIKKIKIKQTDGSFSDYIPIGADAKNIDFEHSGSSVESKLKKTPYYYNNVATMKLDDSLKVGDMAITLGYYEANDGGGAEYVIIDDSSLEDDGGKIHNLANGLKASLTTVGNINVKQMGAKGDGITDDSQFFTTQNAYYLPEGTYLLDRETYKKFVKPNFNFSICGPGKIKFLNYTDNSNSGLVPTNRIYDDIYQAMNAPSDGPTYMTERINGSFNNNYFPMASDIDNIMPIAAVYKNIEKTLPDNFTLYLGRIKMLGYSASTQSWRILCEAQKPSAVRRYRLPWQGDYSEAIDNISIDKESGAYKIPLTKEDFYPESDKGAEGWCIHFWGERYTLKENEYLDLIQLISVFEAWVLTEDGTDITDMLQATASIDSRTASNKVRQINIGKYYGLNGYKKTIWSHTIKNGIFEDIADTMKITELFDKPIERKDIIQRLIVPSQINASNCTGLLGYVPYVNQSGMWNGDFDIFLGSKNTLQHDNISIHIYRDIESNSNTIKFLINKNQTGSRLEKIIAVEDDTENNRFNIYINNIPQYKQCYIIFKELLFTNTKFAFNINTNQMLEKYTGYTLLDRTQFWQEKTFTNTVYYSTE